MSDPQDYCSSCAWPYQCAKARSCKRRDRGEIRSPYIEFEAVVFKPDFNADHVVDFQFYTTHHAPATATADGVFTSVDSEDPHKQRAGVAPPHRGE